MFRLVLSNEMISDFKAALLYVCEGLQKNTVSPGGHVSSKMQHCWFLFPSQSGADSGDLRDNDVRADRGSAAVAHYSYGLLL